ncbi:MAG: M56 family metallopeptidase [Geothrix sp.]|nr:M56 family metallopeptidase [Geothrix sp.]
MRVLGVLAVAALLALGVAVLVGCALAWVYPQMRARVLRLEPGRASAFLLGISVIPWISGGLSVLVCLLPSAFSGLNFSGDHCLEHGGHPHLCLTHGQWQPTLLGLLLVTGLMLGVAVPLARFLWTYWKGRQSLSSMLALGEPDEMWCSGSVRAPQGGVRGGHREPSEQAVPPGSCQGFFRLKVAPPLAFTTGIFRPRVCLSDGLLKALSPEHVEVVLAHEKAHQQRRDGLRLLLAEALTLILPPQLRSQLLGDLVHTTERACDERAALHAGDALQVAEALLAASRLHLGVWPGLWRSMPSFGGGHLRPRVEALVNPPPAAFSAWWAGARAWPAGLLLLGLLVALSGEVHHALESLLGLLSS